MKLTKCGFATLLVLPVLAIPGAIYAPAQINVDSYAPLSVALGPQSMSFVDYSGQSGNYAILKGIEIKANSVKFAGIEHTKVLGTKLNFQRFDVVAPIIVQTSCNVVSGTFGIATARYSLAVAADPTDKARQTFLQQIKIDCQARIQPELDKNRGLVEEKFLWADGEYYILYALPDGDGEGATYLLYASGKVVRLKFEGFVGQGGWGEVLPFLDENVRFRFAETQIRPGYTPEISPRQFLTQLKQGDFKAPQKS